MHEYFDGSWSKPSQFGCLDELLLRHDSLPAAASQLQCSTTDQSYVQNVQQHCRGYTSCIVGADRKNLTYAIGNVRHEAERCECVDVAQHGEKDLQGKQDGDAHIGGQVREAGEILLDEDEVRCAKPCEHHASWFTDYVCQFCEV